MAGGSHGLYIHAVMNRAASGDKWSKKDDSLVVQFEIPFNCTAHFLVPAPYTSAEITDAKGSRVEKEDILRIGSGCYQILCTR